LTLGDRQMDIYRISMCFAVVQKSFLRRLTFSFLQIDAVTRYNWTVQSRSSDAATLLNLD